MRSILQRVALATRLDARRHARDHLPERNLVSTLFELNGIGTLPEAAGPLDGLGVWLPDLGAEAEPVRAAYAEWLSTTMPTVFRGASASEMVDRLTREQEEKDMAYTVLEENLRREFKEREERGERRGESAARDAASSGASPPSGSGFAIRHPGSSETR